MEVTSDFIDKPCKGKGFKGTNYSETLKETTYFVLTKVLRNGKWFVLKSLRMSYKEHAQYEMMLRKEFEIGFQFDHPNITRYLDFIDDDKLGHCILMEYIDGMTLGEFMKTKPSLKAKCLIINDIANGLEAIHEKQVIHRDITLSNIIITSNGHRAKIIDFSLSDNDSYAILKEPAGTENYIAPEIRKGGNEITSQADIYSLGIVLKRMHLPWYYSHLINSCCRQNPSSRHESVNEFQKKFNKARESLATMVVFFAILLAGLAFLFYSYQDKVIEEHPVLIENRETNDSIERVKVSLSIADTDEYSAVEVVGKPLLSDKPKTGSNTDMNNWQSSKSIDQYKSLFQSSLNNIFNPYIEERRQGINEAQMNTAYYAIEKRTKQLYDSLMNSIIDEGLRSEVSDAYIKYYIYKMGIYNHSGKVRKLTPKERSAIKRRDIPRLRKFYGEKYGKGLLDTAVDRP